jgi:HAD superfamily hydrolase (TIGR01490 family)
VATPKQAPALVFFDMDDTLVLRNTATLYVHEQYRAGMVGRRQLARAAWAMAAYRLDLVDMDALSRTAAQQAAGTPEADVHAMCERVFERQVRGLICPQARAALREHQLAGDCVAILTASTPYIARLLAAELGVVHLLATDLEVADGRFTGQLAREACFGVAKLRRAEEFASAHGFDLSSAWFYTDSHSDLPLLEQVAHPCVVRPDLRLRWVAWRRGWPILPW